MRARRVAHRRLRVLRHHGPEGGRGLALVDRQAGRHGKAGAGRLHRPRPARLHPAPRGDPPVRSGECLVVQRPGLRVVEEGRMAPPPRRIGLRAGLEVVVERPEAPRRHHPPARLGCRIGAAKVGAGEQRAVRRVVVRPDRAPVVGTRGVGAFQHPHPPGKQALEERRLMRAVVGAGVPNRGVPLDQGVPLSPGSVRGGAHRGQPRRRHDGPHRSPRPPHGRPPARRRHSCRRHSCPSPAAAPQSASSRPTRAA